MDLFEPETKRSGTAGAAPLAARMRPVSLDDYAGQQHVLGPGKLLRRAIESDRLGSIILYGPPGCGKTSLAEVIATVTGRHFERTSGVLANVAILRSLLEAAEQRKRFRGRETILFIDEIHRFNKAQQDVLLPYVEAGAITLIGATTHNPFFFINTPLTSRSQIFQLEALGEADVVALLRRALTDARGLGDLRIAADDEALAHLARVCEGDARKALNALEIAALTTHADGEGTVRITAAVAEESIQKKAVVYDNEDGHYDTISAFIKSVRGSDPNAALYWLAKMLYAGEDPRFIARRLIILASEDIGNADPTGLTLAVSAMEAVEFIGMPEARIVLAQATTYLATAPKSNASYAGIEAAWTDIREGRTLPVPKHLRDASYKGAERLGHEGYRYAHDYAGHVVDQEYLPTSKIYYQPTGEGYEQRILQRMERWADLRRQQRNEAP
ncbi:MAG TPA: replication-associated recombination protein A [Kiritimatiellia bacterium]|nr:replication-associated recombination protein A [Kiritimatiellia bacterium]HMP35318.1 replication-associated recombination protein A [Kiritimatiellia bacterium]